MNLARREVHNTIKITQFAKVAIKAQEKAASRKMNPKEAWDEAARENIATDPLRAKGCPKEAFLGLCAEGIVKGIPMKPYTDSVENKRYALKAVELLINEPEVNCHTASRLWSKVIKELGRGKVYHNQQMDVVLALWTNHLIQ